MAKNEIITEIDGKRIKLTNLDKVLYPETSLTKAELIEYYLKISPYILPFLSGHPLTLIRYPDGVEGTKFYSKQKAEWTPDWLDTIKVEDITYLNVNNAAALVYVVNLAALELHPMAVSETALQAPRFMIFDLDPPSSQEFPLIKKMCLALYAHLKDFGYHPFVKTSGSKGLHIYVPIIPNYTIEQVFEAAKDIATAFIKFFPEASLKLSKEQRQGKTLIDIYRNHKSQTCVAPFSTRGKSMPSVSMPIHVEEVQDLSDSGFFTVYNAPQHLEKGYAWQHFYEMTSPLHLAFEENTTVELAKYAQKRDFEKTTEPPPTIEKQTTNNHNFVVQLHDAQNLHYDLRLEENGVLTSWAIPKGLPSSPGVKRLAIQTEAHPLKYLDFEGQIPKEEYGGGTMWVFKRGHYELHKKETNSYNITLVEGQLRNNYVLYHTKENQWIIELKASNESEIKPLKPMLALASTTVPDPKQFFFELKWDGIRVIIQKKNKDIAIISRGGRDITASFPEIVEQLLEVDAQDCMIDGEIVNLDANGKPVFGQVISRMHLKAKSQIEMAAKTKPSTCYVFDLMYLDSKDLTSVAIEKRREWLEVIIPKNKANLRLSQAFDDGKALFEAAKLHDLEGIMAKCKTSHYAADKRNGDWLKVKVRTTMDVVIIGYTNGSGDRSALFGALHIAEVLNEGQLKYLGKVGTGFSQELLKEINQLMTAQQKTNKPIKDAVEEESNTTWIDGQIGCEVSYASITPNGTLREPVFIRLKYEGE